MADQDDSSSLQSQQEEGEDRGQEEEQSVAEVIAVKEEESEGGSAEVDSMEGDDPNYLESDGLSSIGPQSSASYASYDSLYSEEEMQEAAGRQSRSTSRVIAIGLPSDEVRASEGISIPMASNDQDRSNESDEEEAQPPPRHLRTPSDANQEAISEVVAEAIAEQEHNEKAGLKKTPVLEAAAAAMLRRESSAVYSRQKGDLLDSSATAEGSLASANRNETSTSFAKDSSISINASLEEQVSEELEAQAGIPVLLPGAFAMVGMSPNVETGYDSGFDDPDENDSEGPVEDLEEDGDQEMAPREILAAELHPSDRPQDQELVAGEVIPEDTAQPKRLLRGRVLQVTVVLVALAVFSAILAAVLVSRNGNSSPSAIETPTTPVGWEQVGEDLRGPSTDDGEEFGYAVSLSSDGMRVAVGMPGWDDGSNQLRVGQTRVFDWDDTGWTLSAEIKGPGVGAEAGSSVALARDGQRVAVGAPSWAGRGQVQVYQAPIDGDEDGSTTWSIIGSPLLGDGSDNGQFGSSVALSEDGSILAVGSPFLNGTFGDDSGLVRVYQFSNSTWTQLGQDIEGESALDLFGWSVALSADGQRLIAGAIGSESPNSAGGFTGQARIFSLIGSQWEQLGQTIHGGSAQDRFGHSVSSNDDATIVAIGVNVQGRNPGYVQVFQYSSDNSEYTQVGEDVVGEADFDSFGYSVSLNSLGDTMAVGSPSNDSGGRDAGQTRVFKFSTRTSSWNQELGEINGSGDNENFGWSVSISSDSRRVASGAPMADFDGRLFEVGRVAVYEVEDE